MFNFFKNSFSKIYNTVTSKLGALFGKTTIDADTLKELELILLQADTGVKTTRTIIATLTKAHASGKIQGGTELKQALEAELLNILNQQKPNIDCNVILLVGINGSGKTTFAGKLAHKAQQEGKKTLFIAADTFRAAAPEQLLQWAQKTDTQIELGKTGQDPASVVFTGCERFKNENFDQLIIDTAGRLQTKTNLMRELEKIKRVIAKQLPDANICTLLTIDAMLGQNSFEQAQLFNESTDVSGVVLTKMDGTGKGGILFSVTDQLHIPIAYISFGETPDAYKLFNAQQYVQELLQI
ncbi:MAG: signal recognition particle-docking protein FtsY [Candidatus Dependentiae bacterium]